MRVTALWVGLGLLSLTGCGDGAGPMVLVVATDATYPPMEYRSNDGRLVGFDIDLMRAIAAQTGFQVTFRHVPWERLFDELAAGRYDAVISSVTITPERAERFDISAPYLDAGQVVVVRAEETDIQGPEDLSGRTVGAVAETTSAAAVTAIAGATLRAYPTIGAAVDDLLAGTLDAVVTDSPVAAGYAQGELRERVKTVGRPFTTEQFGILVRRGHPTALLLINRGLAAVQQSGFDATLRAQWGLP